MTTPSTSTSAYNITGEPDGDVANKMWFEDGSIIIKCSDSVCFRVYQGILAMHSEVFRNMFVVGQASQSEFSDGVAVVEITEDSASMRLLLKILFAPHTAPLSLHTNVSDLCDLLDLSSKYMVEFVCKESARCLHQIFPRTLDVYEGQESYERISEISVGHLFKVTSTAQRHGLLGLLPSAFLVLCTFHYSELDSWPSNDPALTLRIVSTCAKAYPKLLRLKRKTDAHITGALVTASFRTLPTSSSCKSNFQGECISMARKALIIYMAAEESVENPYAYEEDVALFGANCIFLCDYFAELLASTDDFMFCDACLSVWRDGERASRKEAWQGLPACFELATWNELGGAL